MKVFFSKKYLEELYRQGRSSDKHHRFQPEVIKKYKKAVSVLLWAPDIHGLWGHGAFKYERLHGDKAGLSSIRIDRKYRLEFEEKVERGETVATICNIIELSNHYA